MIFSSYDNLYHSSSIVVCTKQVILFPNKHWFLHFSSIYLLKTLCEKDNNEQCVLFPHCFLPFWRTSCYLYQILICRLQTLSVWKSLNIVIWEKVEYKSWNLNPFPNKSLFLCVCSKSLYLSFVYILANVELFTFCILKCRLQFVSISTSL